MNITFNLKDAQVYIPSGRLMNLKHSLKWDEIYDFPIDFPKCKNTILATDFSINWDFSQLLNRYSNEFIKKYKIKAERETRYANLTREVLNDSKISYKIDIHHLSIQSVLNEVKERLENSENLKLKIKKLKQLKEINKL